MKIKLQVEFGKSGYVVTMTEILLAPLNDHFNHYALI